MHLDSPIPPSTTTYLQLQRRLRNMEERRYSQQTSNIIESLAQMLLIYLLIPPLSLHPLHSLALPDVSEILSLCATEELNTCTEDALAKELPQILEGATPELSPSKESTLHTNFLSYYHHRKSLTPHPQTHPPLLPRPPNNLPQYPPHLAPPLPLLPSHA